jgi:Putative phage holin Dp-1
MANMMLTNSTYDKLKRVTQVGLPALGSLYFGLSGIWGLPAGEEVVGSIVLLTTFLGVILGVSTKNYKESDANVDGEIVVQRVEGKKLYALELTGDPHDLENQQHVIFKVVDEETKFWDPSSQV